jgi:ribosome-associated protein
MGGVSGTIPSVSRLPPEIRVTDRVRVPAAEVSLSYARSGGPGGQHVNRTSSKVLLRWNPFTSAALNADDRRFLRERLASRLTTEGDLLITSDVERDQSRNVADALERFVRVVRDAIRRPTPRKATRPTRGSRERRIEAKKRRSSRTHERRTRED